MSNKKQDIKKCGILFIIYSKIRSGLKKVFCWGVFNRERYEKNNPDSMKEKIEKLKNKYPDENKFFDLVYSSYRTSCDKIKKNKRRNFQMKFICLLPFILLSIIFYGGIIKYGIYVLKTQKPISVIFDNIDWKFSVGITVLYAGTIILTKIFSNWINVKQYQETWIRHSSHKHDITIEIFRFTEGVECYKGKNKQKKMEILKKNMLEIWNKNQKKFEENMQKEEKIDVSLENIESWISRLEGK